MEESRTRGQLKRFLSGLLAALVFITNTEAAAYAAELESVSGNEEAVSEELLENAPLFDDISPDETDISGALNTAPKFEDILKSPLGSSKAGLLGAPAPSPDPAPLPFIIMGQDNRGNPPKDLTNSQNATFDYGDIVTLSLIGATEEGTTEFYYNAGSDDGADTLPYPKNTVLEPGIYYIDFYFEAKSDSTVYTGYDENFRILYHFTINKTVLKTPANPAWSEGTVATWDAVTQDVNGRDVASSDVRYIATLYKDNTAIYTTDALSDTSFDFCDYIKGTSKEGIYSFNVKAVTSGSLTSRHFESPYTEVTGSTRAVRINLSKETGIESVLVSENASTEFVLVEGTDAKKTATVGATPSTDWLFKEWVASDSSLTVSSLFDASMTVSLPAGYEGPGAITFTALSTEANPPVIEGYQISGNGFVATITDAQKGLSGYAFSTREDALDVNDYNAASGTEPLSVEYTPSEGGTYYLYAKDTEGNVAKSEGIDVHVINYEGYYSGNERSNPSEIFLGSGEYTLLAIPEGTQRNGFTFAGWYDNNTFSGAPLTSVESFSDYTVTFYAKWDKDLFAFETVSGNQDRTYAGEAFTMGAVFEETTADVEISWQYRASAEDSYADIPSDSNVSLRNVADSGLYRPKAEVTYKNDLEETVTDTIYGDEVSVIIHPAVLTVTAENKEITYADPPPEYTYICEGFVGEDISDNTGAGFEAGSLKCVYDPDDEEHANAGTYAITEDASFTAANYEINFVDGTLTVGKRDVSGNADITVTLSKYSYLYDGEEHRPEVTVEDKNARITEEDFTLVYENNVECGTASDSEESPRVKIKFRRNYTGTLYVPFSIEQDNFVPTIYMGSWTYGDTPDSPVIDETRGAEVTYYYLDGTVTDPGLLTGGTTEKPENAGTYTVYAVCAATRNYRETKSNPVTFTIGKKTIVLTAASNDQEPWVYDGNEHTLPYYTQDGSFVLPSESFHSIQVTGTIVNAGEVENVVSYVLSSATNAGNYDIQTVNGVLKVVSTDLPAPGNRLWSSVTPGKATWVAVTRPNVTMHYEVKLYRHDENGDECIKTVETASTSYDFSTDIHNDFNAGEKKAYLFTVKAVPYSGTGMANYRESAESEMSARLYTATLTLTMEDREGDGLEDLFFADYAGGTVTKKNGVSEVTLIQGESAVIAADKMAGYYFSDTGVQKHKGSFVSIGSTDIIHDLGNEYYVSKSCLLENGNRVAYRVSLNSLMNESVENIVFTANTADSDPSVSDMTAENAADLSHVRFTAKIFDELGLKEWQLEKVSERTEEREGKTYTYYDHEGFLPLHVLEEGTKGTVNIEEQITEDGIYRLRLFDDSDNGVTVSDSKNFVTVYKVEFNRGTGTGGEMAPVFKLANTKPNLPANAFTKTGYKFINWSGAETGISADRAVYAANKSDVLTAQWANEKIGYTVRYFYMKTDGTYASTPDNSAVFQADWGALISVNDSGIQKPRSNYSLDTSEGHNNSFTLTTAGQVLDIYYKTGKYTITYTYTLPKAEEPTVITEDYFYGAQITELTKPSYEGYDFVGWDFSGTGTAPDTMPAYSLNASGRFVAKSATYKVVYHFEDLGTGETKAETYTLGNTAETYKSKHDTVITAYLSKSSEPAENEVVAPKYNGFTINSVVFTSGMPSVDGAMPLDALRDNTSQATVTYDNSQMLYINYYYTRNVYTFAVDVYRDSREPGKRIFRKTESRQYDEPLTATIYENDALFLDESNPLTDDTGNAFVMPENYKFTSYTDYSTGNAPEKMPAGNVTVTRDVVSDETVEYKVEVYLEGAEIGTFNLATTVNFTAAKNNVVHILEGSGEDFVSGNDTYVYSTTLSKSVNHSEYYDYKIRPESVTTGMAQAGSQLVLKAYYERKETETTVIYYYGNGIANGNKEFARFTLKGKWGTLYKMDPDALFDSVDTDWFENNEIYQSQNISKDITYNKTNNEKTAWLGEGNTAVTKDFRHDNYLVSYQMRYDYFDANENTATTYPAYTLTTLGTGSVVAQSKAAGLTDTITGTFGIKSAEGNSYCRIYYNRVEEKEDFYLAGKINTDSSAFPKRQETVDVTGNVLSVYTDSRDMKLEYNGVSYPLRVMNMSQIVNCVAVNSAGELDEYPAANLKGRKYKYTSLDDTKPGFTHIAFPGIAAEDYYLYDPSVSGNHGDEPCIFIADYQDRFRQGAYVSWNHNSLITFVRDTTGNLTYDSNGLLKVKTTGTSPERQLINNIMTNYQAVHSDPEKPDLYDETYTALYVYSVGWGSSYVYGNNSNWNATYRHRDAKQITYFFQNQTCTLPEHKYPYGTRVPKEAIGCLHLTGSVLPGYTVTWYTNGRCADTDLVPEDGLLMDRDRSLYGKLEHQKVENKEYIYYQIADPITIGDTTYSYITQDNLATITGAGYTVTTKQDDRTVYYRVGDEPYDSEVVKVTTYMYNGEPAFVEIPRPAYAFSEIYLTKDKDELSYEDAYGKTGFYYDETNTDNRSYGYVNTTSLALKVYFARDKYQVEFDAKLTNAGNPEYRTLSIGQTVDLGIPSKNGYTFDHWKWYRWNSVLQEYFDYTPDFIDEDTGVFSMPDCNLKAEAVWTPAAFPQKITHYFQCADLSYPSEFIKSVGAGCVSSAETVIYKEREYQGTVYRNVSSEIEAVVVEEPAARRTVYFDGAKEAAGKVYLEEANLAVIEEMQDMTSEDVVPGNTFAADTLTIFDFSYSTVRSGNNFKKVTSLTTYEVTYAMTVELFYTRKANYSVRLAALACDNGETEIALSGDKICYYGETATFSALLSEGYTFMGWYDADELLEGLKEDKENTPDYDYSASLSNYGPVDNLAEVLDGLTPLYEGLTIHPVVTKPLDLVAVVYPNDVVPLDLEVKGKTAYVYGYEKSSANTLMAVANVHRFTKAECPGASDEEINAKNLEAAQTTVTSYQWYKLTREVSGGEPLTDVSGNPVLKEEILEGQTASTFLFEENQNAGTYRFRCKIEYKRVDNERTGASYCDATVVVDKSAITVSTSKYEGIFDSRFHSIGLSLTNRNDSAYTIYYSTDVVLTEQNHGDIGSLTRPEYRNAKYNVSDNQYESYVTYFYIEDHSGNYTDLTGSEKVTISPKNITIEATDRTFSKVYDGLSDISGNVIVSGNDKFNFSQGDYYELVGVVAGDSDVEGYTLDATVARYNSPHVNFARTFDVSNMFLVRKNDGSTVRNYVFDPASTITFSGFITARELDVEWDAQRTFVYDGQEHAPAVSIAEEQRFPVVGSDAAYISLDTKGKQSNYGTYTATATAVAGEGATFDSGDYTFAQMTCDYSITKRNVIVRPVDDEVAYDGESHAAQSYTAGLSVSGGDDGVLAEHTHTAQPSVYKINAGSYDDMKMQNLVIKNGSGIIMNDNYLITYETGNLVIKPASVTVSGITASDKDYDGTDAAVLDVSQAVFNPLFTQGGEEDELYLDPEKVVGHFADIKAGTDTVNITYLEGALQGASKDNYTFDVSLSQAVAPAYIGKNCIQVTVSSLETVYGEEAPFVANYDNIVKADGTPGTKDDITITGTPVFEIKVADEWVLYVPGNIEVGTYDIRADVSGLFCADYNFAWNDVSGQTLTVKKRPVTIKASETADIVKPYDATAAVSSELIVKGEDYEFAGVSGNAASGVLAKDYAGFDLVSFKASYNSANVKDAVKVTLSDMVISDTANYVLADSTLDIDAAITKLDLEVSFTGKSVIYGNAGPSSYDVSFNGFFSGEGLSDIHGTVSFANEYDISDALTRGVGKYDVYVTASGFAGDNYAVKYKGTELGASPVTAADLLTVNRATVTVTPDDKTMRFRIGDNNGLIPEMTWKYSGWKYGENENTDGISVALSPITAYTTKGNPPTDITIDRETVAGAYTIRLKDVPATTDNYTFTVKTGTFKIEKSYLYISSGKLKDVISIASKVYDGNSSIAASSITENREALLNELSDSTGKGADYLYDVDKQYLTDHPAEKILGITNTTASYSDKNAGTNKAVTVNYTLGTYLAARYELKTASTDRAASADITKKPLTVTATVANKGYGNSFKAVKNNFGYTHSDTVSGEDITAAYGFSGTVAYSCEYDGADSSYPEVGGYAVTPYGLSASNYEITFVPVNVKITQSAMGMATPVWVDEEPGKVTWTASAKKGNVTVDHYNAKLYRNGGSSAVDSVDTTDLFVNFSAKMKEEPGEYTVKVIAVPSTENNEGNKNVKNSGAKATENNKYSAKVIPVLKDKVGNVQSGKGAQVTIGGVSGDPVSIEGLRSVVLIAGETASVSATLKNSTGYTVSTASSSEKLTTKVAGSLDAASSVYSDTVEMSTSLASYGNITYTVTLNARPATLGYSLLANNITAEGVSYMFNEWERPYVYAVPAVVNDNVTTDDYTYTYEWKYRAKSMGVDTFTLLPGETADIYKLPVKFDGTNYTKAGTYDFQCTKVTAVRKDNGETITLTKPTTGIATVTLKIKKGSYDPELAFTGTGTANTWVYGEARKIPLATHLCEEITEENYDEYISLEFSESSLASGTWSSQWLTDAGTHYVRANIKATENYAEKVTDAIPYVVLTAELDAPSNLHMEAKENTAQYGLACWDEVNPPLENGENCELTVTYNVKVYESDAAGNIIGEAKYEADNIAGTSVDIASVINHPEKIYVFTVRSKSSNTNNCDHSEFVKSSPIFIGTDVVATATTKIYDASPITLSVSYDNGSGTEVTFQWYKNGSPIHGATEDTYKLTYVEESAIYSCEITQGVSSVHSVYKTITINPYPIVVETDSDTKNYDAAALTNGGWNIKSTTPLCSYDGVTDIATLTMTGTQTSVGSSNNTYTDLVIKRGGKTVYAEDASYNNYTVTPSYGTLSVTARSLGTGSAYTSAITVDDISAKTYNGAAHTPAPVVKDAVTGTAVTLAEGTDYSLTYASNTNVGTASITITGKGNYTGSITKTFEIVPLSLGTNYTYNDVSVNDMPSRVYNTLAYAPTVTAYETGLASGANYKLIEGTDYSVEYINNVNAGTATAVITGKGNYCGTIKKDYTITKSSTLSIAAISAETYNGAQHRPFLTVTDTNSKAVLTEGTDYTVTYTNNINHGTATATVHATGNYDKEISEDFTINPKSIGTNYSYSHDVALGTIEDHIYDSLEYKPEPYVKDSGLINDAGEPQEVRTLTKGTDYTLSYESNIYAGTGTITFTGTGNYTGAIKKNFTITKRDIEITADSESYVYNGTNQFKKTVSVTAGALQGSDAVTPTINTTLKNVGTVTNTLSNVVIKRGTADATASYNITLKNGSLTITPRSLGTGAAHTTGITVEDIADKIYLGTDIKPEPVVKDAGLATGTIATLVKTTDYTVAYSDNQNAGTATITITGNGNYKDSITKTFTIKKSSTLAIDEIPARTYNGAHYEPVVTVRDTNSNAVKKVLVLGEDYDVFYNNNLNAGTATVRITAKGNYEGYVDRDFTINPKSLGSSTKYASGISFADVEGKVYDGLVYTPEVTVSDSKLLDDSGTTRALYTLVSGNDYSVDYGTTSTAGTRYVSVTGMGNYTGTVKKGYQITKRPITVKADDALYEYNRASRTAKTYTITSGTLAENDTLKSCTFNAESKITDVGTMENVITAFKVKRTESGSEVTSSYEITLVPGIIEVVPKSLGEGETLNTGITFSISKSSLTYSGSPLCPAITVKDSKSTLVSGNEYIVDVQDNLNVGTATITVSGIGNYAGSIIKNFTVVASKNIEVDAVDTVTYRYQLYKPTPEVRDSVSKAVLTEGVDYEYTYSANRNAGEKAKVSVKGMGNYTGTKTVYFTILPYNIGDGTNYAPGVKVSGSFSKVYDGLPYEPSFTVKVTDLLNDDGTPKSQTLSSSLVRTFENNVKAGTATAYMEGINSYTGKISKTFTITKRPLTFEAGTVTYEYNGVPQSFVSGSAAGETSLAETDTAYPVINTAVTNVGTYTNVLSGIVIKNEALEDVTASYEIAPFINGSLTITARPLNSGSSYNAGITVEDISDKVYNGGAHIPAVTVKDAGLATGVQATLVLNRDYTVEYSNNTLAGTATITISGMGNYCGEITKTFRIKKSSSLALDDIVSRVYDGSHYCPLPVVRDTESGLVLVKDTDYMVSYSNNLNRGIATVSVTAQGNYEGTFKKEFLITAKNLGNDFAYADNILVDGIESRIYDGTAYEPSTTVKDSGLVNDSGAPQAEKRLVLNTDYTVVYTNNIQAGIATVTINGTGNYGGSIRKTFEIRKRVIEYTADSLVSPFNGKAQTKPTGSVTKGTLALGDVAIPVITGSQTDIGSSVNHITGLVIKNQSGEVVTSSYDYGTLLDGMLTVTGRSLGDGEDYTLGIQVANILEKIYDGSAFTPEPVVKDVGLASDGKTLVKGVDYTVSYRNNIDAGTADIIINGKGNYYGEIIKHFTINRSGAVTIADIPSKVYDGSAYKPSITVTDTTTGDLLEEGTEYAFVYENNVDAGIATIRLTALGNYEGTFTKEYEITAKPLGNLYVYEEDITVGDIADRVYDGTEYMPAPQVKDSGLYTVSGAKSDEKTLLKNVDYTVNYINNIHAGTATVTYSGIGNYEGTIKKNYSINKRVITYTANSLDSVYDGTYQKNPTGHLTSGTLAEGDVLLSPVIRTTRKDAGTSANHIEAILIENAEGKDVTGDYDYGTLQDGVINIAPRSFGTGASYTSGITVDDIAGIIYNGGEITPAVTIKDTGLLTGTGETLVKGRDYSVSYNDNVDAGTATISMTGIGNYCGTVTKTFTIIESKTIVATNPSDVVYSGTAYEPVLVVTDNVHHLTLVEGRDYDVTYENNVNAGIAKVIITCKGNFEKTVEKEFVIKPLTVKVTADSDEKVFDNAPLTKHSYELTGTLAAGEHIDDAAIVYSGSVINVEAAVTVNTPSNVRIYKASGEETTANYLINYAPGYLKVTAKPLNEGSSYASTITVDDIESFEYDGTNHTPAPVVTDTLTGETLVERKDYTVTYSAHNNAGEALITITGKGNYSGTITKNFTITKRPLEITAGSDNKVYDASALTCSEYEITAGTLVNGQSLVSVLCTGSVTDVLDVSTNNVPSAAVIKAGTVNVADNYDITYINGYLYVTKAEQVVDAPDVIEFYDGEYHEVVATVTFGDGTVTYSENNRKMYTCSETVTYEVSETRNFFGTNGSAYLQIERRPITIAADSANREYTGEPLTCDTYSVIGGLGTGDVVMATVSGQQTEKGESENIVLEDTVTIKKGALDVLDQYDITYVAGQLLVGIAPRTISVEENEFVYDGEEHKLVATSNGDGEPRYAGNSRTLPGTTTVFISYEETENYGSKNITIDLIVKKRPVTIAAESKKVETDKPVAIRAENCVVKAGSLVKGHYVEGTVSGNQDGYGSSASTVSDVKIYDASGNDVTEYYEITLENGSLVVTNPPPKEDVSQNDVTPNDEKPVEKKPVKKTEASSEPDTEETDVSADVPDDVSGNAQADVSESEGNEAHSDVSENVPDEDSPISKEESEEIFRSGNVIVTIETTKDIQNIVALEKIDKSQIIRAVLSREELELAKAGNKMEIRLTVNRIFEEEVWPVDTEIIQRQINELQPEIPGLSLGAYLDIKLDKRFYNGEWTNVDETKEDIDIVISIPEEMRFENTRYFISRVHNHREKLLYDLDKNDDTVTTSTKYFSTYALLYVREDGNSGALWWWIPIIAWVTFHMLAYEKRRREQDEKEAAE